MHLRAVSIEDAPLLFEWRNDPLTRANSLSTDAVEYASHLAWVQRAIDSPMRDLYLAVVDGVPVGTVRFDRDGDVRELSWTIAPEHRGQGHGKQMVRLAAGMSALPVRAVIKVGNIASIKIAEAAGLGLVSASEGLLHYARHSV